MSDWAAQEAALFGGGAPPRAAPRSEAAARRQFVGDVSGDESFARAGGGGRGARAPPRTGTGRLRALSDAPPGDAALRALRAAAPAHRADASDAALARALAAEGGSDARSSSDAALARALVASRRGPRRCPRRSRAAGGSARRLALRLEPPSAWSDAAAEALLETAAAALDARSSFADDAFRRGPLLSGGGLGGGGGGGGALPGQPHAANKRGCYVVRLCCFGLWRLVVVDDSLPTLRGRPCFAGVGGSGPLVEKAAAKVYGGYELLSGGHVRSALALLTGWPCGDHSLDLHDAQGGSVEDKRDVLWLTLLSLVEARAVCCASARTDAARLNAVGLNQRHAYSVVDVVELTDLGGTVSRLVRLRDPHGDALQRSWAGDWSAADLARRPRELGDALRSRGAPDPSTQWLSFADLGATSRVSFCEDRSAWAGDLRAAARAGFRSRAATTTRYFHGLRLSAAKCGLATLLVASNANASDTATVTLEFTELAGCALSRGAGAVRVVDAVPPRTEQLLCVVVPTRPSFRLAYASRVEVARFSSVFHDPPLRPGDELHRPAAYG
ncbi:calcium-dependent cysteine-type endopeptidase [Aureococcus anophagefferens]|nr:calcium-dependent cysteine-type endopeptidase [Aureococcus anophagefferens]